MSIVMISDKQRACAGFVLANEKNWMLREKRASDGFCHRAKNILRCKCYSGSLARELGEYGRCRYYDDSMPGEIKCLRPGGPAE